MLEVWMRYPDLMNDTELQVEMVTDKSGNPIFNTNSKCIDGFEQDLMKRRDEDGDVLTSFSVKFKTEQKPKFLKVHAGSTGLDIIRGEYLDGDNQLCTYKVLQFLTKEKDPDLERSTAGEEIKCGVRIKKNKRSKEANSPFLFLLPYQHLVQLLMI